ncbi:DUF4134 family protein [Dyadobacter alkalitolerans]|uniref:DUF4134 family protein n=1 Tax=Dyadobacter alkalitolerans TaxID=492736 RepID=UPI0003F73160|nr:DUF4134 family protein [Dyadobacter alkalitolerans]
MLENGPFRRARQVWAAALLSVMATIAKAQDGAAGISEADSQVRSYFEPGTQLMYEVLPFGWTASDYN